MTVCADRIWPNPVAPSFRVASVRLQPNKVRATGLFFRSAGQVPPMNVRQFESFALSTTQSDLNALKRLGDDWDGAGSPRPNPVAIAKALADLPTMFELAAGRWIDPHVSASEGGHVTLEWWRAGRKLTVYVGERTVEFVKVWGADIFDEMSSGVFEDDLVAFSDAWEWLIGA